MVGLVGGEVGRADDVVDAPTRPADDGDHVVAGCDLGDVGAHLGDHAEALVAEHEVVGTGRGGAVLAGVDLLVGAVEADPEDLDEHAPAPGDLVEAGLGDVPEGRAVRGAGDDGDRVHNP